MDSHWKPSLSPDLGVILHSFTDTVSISLWFPNKQDVGLPFLPGTTIIQVGLYPHTAERKRKAFILPLSLTQTDAPLTHNSLDGAEASGIMWELPQQPELKALSHLSSEM